MSEKNYSVIKAELDAYLNDSVANKSILPSLLNASLTDVIDSLVSRINYVVQRVQNLTISTGVVTIDLQSSNHFNLTLDENITIEYTNAPSTGYNGTYCINVTNDSTGGYTITNGLNVVDVDGIADFNNGGDSEFQIWLYWNGSELIKNIVNL